MFSKWLLAASAGILGLGWPVAAATPASGRTITVDMVNIEFRPTRIQIQPGDRIRFLNKDPFEHTALLVNAANPNDVVLPDHKVTGKSSYTTEPIQREGVFILYCTIHGGMKAKVSTTGTFQITEAMRQAAAAALPPEVKAGEALFWGKAQCSRCHRIGKRGDQTRGPNLEDIGLRAKSRAQERGLGSATEYLIESILKPGAYVVPGYVDDMEKVYQPPLDLTEEKLTRLVAYLQSQAGKVDTWAIDIPQAVLSRPVPTAFPVKGDPEAGREAFDDFDCASCHRIGGKSGGLGPELTHIGAYRNRAFFVREILDPNAVVAPGFRPIDLEIKSKGNKAAKSYSGVLVRETPEAYVVKLSDESIRTFPKAEVRRVSKQSETVMPDFTEVMTAKQLADLLAYLQSLK